MLRPDPWLGWALSVFDKEFKFNFVDQAFHSPPLKRNIKVSSSSIYRLGNALSKRRKKRKKREVEPWEDSEYSEIEGYMSTAEEDLEDEEFESENE